MIRLSGFNNFLVGFENCNPTNPIFLLEKCCLPFLNSEIILTFALVKV